MPAHAKANDTAESKYFMAIARAEESKGTTITKVETPNSVEKLHGSEDNR
jgi:hypothetical protein